MNSMLEVYMLSIGHIAGQLAAGRKNLKNIITSLTPDTIRCLKIARTVTHFTGTQPDKCSWIIFPKNAEELSSFNENTKYEFHQEELIPCVVDEKTNISLYEEKNYGVIDEEIFKAIKYHLTEDTTFDAWLRNKIDFSKKYEDVFVYKGKTLNGKELRDLITYIEQVSVYVYAQKLYKEQGITYTNEWIKENIRPVLFEVFSEKVAQTAYSYMQIKPEFNDNIANHIFDYSDIEPELVEELTKLHEQIIQIY